MTYSFLDPTLQSYAEQAVGFFVQEWNLPKSKFKRESPIRDDLPWSPAVHALKKSRILCIELFASEDFDASLLSFLIKAREEGLPIELYLVRYPGRLDYPARFLDENGIGVLDLDGVPRIIRSAVIQSLVGVRSVFVGLPKKHREVVQQALHTYRGGDPVKGCLKVFERLEEVTRNIARRASKKGAWKGKPPEIDVDTGNWHDLAIALINRLDFVKLGCRNLSKELTRVAATTDPRNLTAHPPKTPAQRTLRDQRARTWFEAAADLLTDLTKATRF